MPLPLPNIDDRTFSDLSVELRSLIQRYDRRWTNHNPSDPGITLIELLAWLAEMLLYRMNRVERRNYLTFLELIGLQPSAPSVELTFKIDVPKIDLPANYGIPLGTRVSALDEKTGEAIEFETTAYVYSGNDNWDEDGKLWVLKAPAVNTVVIEDELLGFSNGAPLQEFYLKQPPVFLDRENEGYFGNPVIMIGEANSEWRYRSDLLSSPGEDVFTVEHLAGLIRFGDGTNGNIPPAGSKITCTYRRLGGTAGNVAAGRITVLSDSGGINGITAVTVSNEYPATGGVDGESLEDLLARGLATLQEVYRAVSEDDFILLAQRAAPDKVARASAVANLNLEWEIPSIEAGHISVIVLPAKTQLSLQEQPAEYDTVSKVFKLYRTNALMGIQATKLNRVIYRFLYERRLITTVVHVVSPSFTSLSLAITLQARPGVNPETLTKKAGHAVAAFLDPYEGWEDDSGWPFGRDVYRSELYQVIEDVDGVDHVEKLVMNGDATISFITVGGNRLVSLDKLSVTVK